MWAAVGKTFKSNVTLNESSTVSMQFVITSEDEGAKTCSVQGDYDEDFDEYTASINTSTQGAITIPESVDGYTVTGINSYAFYGCKKITSVAIPSGVTAIGEYAFYNCQAMTATNMPDDLTSLGQRAFYGCKELASISGTGKYTSIQALTFCGCSKLSSLTIPVTTTSIGNRAFENSGLTSITIPASVTSIGTTPFNGCSSLTEATVNCTPVKGMFSGATALKRVTLGEGVTSIPNEFFKGTALEEFTIGSSITNIGSSAFENCTQLTAITIPENVTSVQPLAFKGCTGLASVTFSGTPQIPAIYDATFQGCTALTSITIPASVTSIGGSVFDGCTSLATVTNNATLTSIGGYAFRGTKITGIELASGLTSIGLYTFADITTLTSLTIPSTVKEIGSYAFKGCTGVATLSIPSIVTTIGQNAFEGCTGLSAIELPGTLTSLGDYAFSGCTGATTLTIAEGVTTIPQYAFQGCSSIKNVTIPASVTTIEQNAFSGCSSLEWIDARQTSATPAKFVRTSSHSYDYGIFYGTPESAIIYLSKGFSQPVTDDALTNFVFTDANDVATCPDYQFDAGKAVVLPAGFTATKATATRSFAAQQKSTVYLPFAISETEAAALGKFYEFDKVDGDVVSFKSATATVGGKAYLFEPASALTEIVAENTAVVATAADATTEGLKGVYEETVITEGLDKIYFWAAADGAFSNATSKLTVPATRAYLQLLSAPQQARMLVSFDGEATGIATIGRDGRMDIQTVYDLQGRRVERPAKGSLYIVGGKKIIY